MKANCIMSDSTLTVRLKERLDTNTSPELDKKLADIFSKHTVTEVRFDLSDLDYISSSGLRILPGTLKKVDSVNGKAYIENPNDCVMNILNMTGFDTLFEIVYTQDAYTANDDDE